MTNQDLLKEIYFDTKTGFISLDKLYKKVKSKGILKKEVKQFYDSLEVKQIYKPIKKNKTYFPIYCNGDCFQADNTIY